MAINKSLAAFVWAFLSTINEEKVYEASFDLPGNDQDFSFKVRASIAPGLKITLSFTGEPKAPPAS